MHRWDISRERVLWVKGKHDRRTVQGVKIGDKSAGDMWMYLHGVPLESADNEFRRTADQNGNRRAVSGDSEMSEFTERIEVLEIEAELWNDTKKLVATFAAEHEVFSVSLKLKELLTELRDRRAAEAVQDEIAREVVAASNKHALEWATSPVPRRHRPIAEEVVANPEIAPVEAQLPTGARAWFDALPRRENGHASCSTIECDCGAAVTTCTFWDNSGFQDYWIDYHYAHRQQFEPAPKVFPHWTDSYIVPESQAHLVDENTLLVKSNDPAPEIEALLNTAWEASMATSNPNLNEPAPVEANPYNTSSIIDWLDRLEGEMVHNCCDKCGQGFNRFNDAETDRHFNGTCVTQAAPVEVKLENYDPAENIARTAKEFYAQAPPAKETFRVRITNDHRDGLYHKGETYEVLVSRNPLDRSLTVANRPPKDLLWISKADCREIITRTCACGCGSPTDAISAEIDGKRYLWSHLTTEQFAQARKM